MTNVGWRNPQICPITFQVSLKISSADSVTEIIIISEFFPSEKNPNKHRSEADFANSRYYTRNIGKQSEGQTNPSSGITFPSQITSWTRTGRAMVIDRARLGTEEGCEGSHSNLRARSKETLNRDQSQNNLPELFNLIIHQLFAWPARDNSLYVCLVESEVETNIFTRW